MRLKLGNGTSLGAGIKGTDALGNVTLTPLAVFKRQVAVIE